MGRSIFLALALSGLLLWPTVTDASTGDIGSIIESFVARQFPDSVGHYWVINDTQWDGDEMIVDVHTIVQEKREVDPTLNRFLLLIVAGELKAVQNVPVGTGTDCRPEEEA